MSNRTLNQPGSRWRTPRVERDPRAEVTCGYDRPSPQPPPRSPVGINMDPESSFELLEQAKSGDPDALDRLLRRYLMPLRRWASGRLPRSARDISDTQDVVQEAIVHTLKHLQDFQPTRDGALHAYLRTAVMNRIRDELRRARRRPAPKELDENMAAAGGSPLATAISQEAFDRYEAALGQLREEEREIVIARVDFGLAYEEIAIALGRPSADAARVAVRRSLLKIADIMKRTK
jgi:RNA polymerase sigma factor (sigma-70 family)